MGLRSFAASILLVATLNAVALHACVFKYGTSPDSLVPPYGGTHWDHGMLGDDWNGEDASGKPWVCMTGHHQSPINLPSKTYMTDASVQVPAHLRTQWNYPILKSDGHNIEVINNGHAIQVEWLYPWRGAVKIAVANRTDSTITSLLHMHGMEPYKYLTAVPIQFHFHANSEHTIAGHYYPLELHIVHKIVGGIPACERGCFSVTGIVFELCVNCADNPLIEPIWKAMPNREGQINYLPVNATIALDRLIGLPEERSYYTYEGSLTTPPCSEGLLWHVLLKPQPISIRQWRKYMKAVAFKQCTSKNSTRGGSAHVHHHHRRSLQSRSLLASEATGKPNDYNCTVFAYGNNYRLPQPLHNRIVKFSNATPAKH